MACCRLPRTGEMCTRVGHELLEVGSTSGVAYSPTRRRLRYIYDRGKNEYELHETTVQYRGCEVGLALGRASMHVYRPGTEYGQMTGGFMMMMMDFSDLFVSLSLCLSLCLSLYLSLCLSLYLSLPDLSVALCLVRCTPRVGVRSCASA